MHDADHPLAPTDDGSMAESEELGEGVDDPDCQIDGCDRAGAVPRTFHSDNAVEPTSQRYVCRYHHRVLVGLRLVIIAAVIAVFLAAFFRV